MEGTAARLEGMREGYGAKAPPGQPHWWISTLPLWRREPQFAGGGSAN